MSKRFVCVIGALGLLLAVAEVAEAGRFFRRGCSPVVWQPCDCPATGGQFAPGEVVYYPPGCCPYVVISDRKIDNGKIDDGKTTDGKTINPNTKVAALFVFDTDDETKGQAGIKTTAKTVQTAFDQFCPPDKRDGDPKVINLNREGGVTPEKVLSEIQAWKTTDDDILLVYFCCHGAIIEDEHLLFVDPDNPKKGTKRADVVNALKSKKHYSAVLITDACAEEVKNAPKVEKAFPPAPKDLLYKMCAALPKGQFVDLNTCSPGQIAAIASTSGSAASKAFLETFQAGTGTFKEGKVEWKPFQDAWQEGTNKQFKLIKQGALGANPNDAHYSKQDSQDFERFDKK